VITVELTNQDNTEKSLVFMCPGCGEHHPVRIKSADAARPCWTWNGDRDKPTFSPSLLVRYDYTDGRPQKVCHSFIREGRIEFLGDCTHDKAGQTLDLPACEW
jgi:uncharacterized protein DUF6527